MTSPFASLHISVFDPLPQRTLLYTPSSGSGVMDLMIGLSSPYSADRRGIGSLGSWNTSTW